MAPVAPRRTAMLFAIAVQGLLLIDASTAGGAQWSHIITLTQSAGALLVVTALMEIMRGRAVLKYIAGIAALHQVVTAGVLWAEHNRSGVILVYLPVTAVAAVFANTAVRARTQRHTIAVFGIAFLSVVSIIVGDVLKDSDAASLNVTSPWVDLAVAALVVALSVFTPPQQPDPPLSPTGRKDPSPSPPRDTETIEVCVGPRPMYINAHNHSPTGSTGSDDWTIGGEGDGANPLSPGRQTNSSRGALSPRRLWAIGTVGASRNSMFPEITLNDSCCTVADESAGKMSPLAERPPPHPEGEAATRSQSFRHELSKRGSLSVRAGFSRNNSFANNTASEEPAPFPFRLPEKVTSRPRQRVSVGSQKTIHEIKWRMGALIGSGGFGTVHIGLNESSGQLMAVKTIKFDPHAANVQNRLAMLANEIQLMRTLHHPCLVSYYFAERVESSLHIFMEYVPGGSLLGVLQQFGPLSDNLAATYTPQILLGLAYLHSQGVVHRDIKCANVLLTAEGMCKLADFGSAAHLENLTVAGSGGPAGTPQWMAPEVLAGQAHGSSCDIWSLGCCVMEMLTAKAPFAHINAQPLVIVQKVVSADRDALTLPPRLKPNARLFLKECLVKAPSGRPTADHLLEHQWIAEDTETILECMSTGASPLGFRKGPRERNFDDNSTIGDGLSQYGGMSPYVVRGGPTAFSPHVSSAAASPLTRSPPPHSATQSSLNSDIALMQHLKISAVVRQNTGDLLPGEDCSPPEQSPHGDTSSHNSSDFSGDISDDELFDHAELIMRTRIQAARSDLALRMSLLRMNTPRDSMTKARPPSASPPTQAVVPVGPAADAEMAHAIPLTRVQTLHTMDGSQD